MRATTRRPLRAPWLLALAGLALAGCAADPPSRHPFVVIGVDGAELRVVEKLWSEGRLPQLRALAERGTVERLRTRYGKSPVIWTSVATGVKAERHGILGFTIPTERGDVPISSELRRVPAIWNMLSAVNLRVATLSWWATWPAEQVNGILVSDRIGRGLEESVWPPAWQARAQQLLEEVRGSERRFPGPTGLRDHFVDEAGRELATEGFDLLMVYFKAVDEVSHRYWKYYQPARFPPIDAQELAANAERVPAVYERVDRSVGELIAAAGPDVNYLVLSDHGFRPMHKERVRVPISMDRVLEHFGYLVRAEDGKVDLSASELFSHASPSYHQVKKLRFARAARDDSGQVPEAARAAVRNKLAADLATVRYGGGESPFKVREPTRKERADGAELVVQVSTDGATRKIFVGGKPIRGAVGTLSHISGTHDGATKGLFIAAGPDIAPGADIDGISIFDITPTLLYGLGLPTAEDFDGRAWTSLFTDVFRAAHPLRTIDSWGAREAGEALTSEADEELLDELRALGYLE